VNKRELKFLAKLIDEGAYSFENGNFVQAPHIAAFENHVQSLRASPLFNLSLASIELFHSNFLAWLCETYPNLVVSPLFARYTKTPCASCDGVIVRREKSHIDLTIRFPNDESLIVENKVKSVASLEQLKEYCGKAREKKRTSFLLLSLIRPLFVPPNDAMFQVDDTSWHFLSYRDMVDLLEPAVARISAINRYHGELVGDYLGFVRSLVAIASHFSVDWGNEEADFFINHEHRMLEEIRLYAMMDKMRYAQLAEKIKEALTCDGCSVLTKAEFWAKDAKPGVFLLDSGHYRGGSLCEFKYLARGGENEVKVTLGVMFQGNTIKVFVQLGTGTARGSSDSAKRIAKELMSPRVGGKVWFDLARIPGNERELPVNGFNQYIGICFYRCKKIAQISPKALVDLLVSYARSIRDAEDTIRSQIDAACETG
jgi:hypothetical protein